MIVPNVTPMPWSCRRKEYDRGVSAHVAGDYNAALRAFRAGARRGHAPARFMLGSMYHKGEGVVKDPVEALAQYLVSAGGGEPRAAYVLGCMYCMGDTVEEDLGQAEQWFRLSAARGYAPAQFSLGTMFSSGTDIRCDPDEAMKWFLLAAAQGHRQALHELRAMAAGKRRTDTAVRGAMTANGAISQEPFRCPGRRKGVVNRR